MRTSTAICLRDPATEAGQHTGLGTSVIIFAVNFHLKHPLSLLCLLSLNSDLLNLTAPLKRPRLDVTECGIVEPTSSVASTLVSRGASTVTRILRRTVLSCVLSLRFLHSAVPLRPRSYSFKSTFAGNALGDIGPRSERVLKIHLRTYLSTPAFVRRETVRQSRLPIFGKSSCL